MRVAVIGPQNTGKSTFLSDLQKALPHFHIPAETYRDVIRKNNLPINQMTGTESQRLIRDFIMQQVASATGPTLFDRCLIDNYVYTCYAHTQGNIDNNFLTETEEFLHKTAREIDLYLFVPSALSVPLVADDLRDVTPGYVDTINRLFIETLFTLIQKEGIRVRTIGGTREERVAAACAALDSL